MHKPQRRMLCLTFPADLIQFLDGLAWEMLRKSGTNSKLDRMAILRALVQVFKEGKFDVTGLRSEDEFVETLLSQIRARRKKGTTKRRTSGGT